MEIKINCKNYALCIQLGRKANWYKSMYLITITKEYYDENFEVITGEWIKGIYKRRIK